MKTIQITVSIDGNGLRREYSYDECTQEVWGNRVLDMLDTIEQSKKVKF